MIWRMTGSFSSGHFNAMFAGCKSKRAWPTKLIQGLREYTPPGRADAVRIFGESLPQGLRLIR